MPGIRTAPGVLEIPPEGIAAWAGRLDLAPAEVRLLAPDHPFLRTGTWRAFVAGDGRPGTARLVASVDPRQRDAAGPVGCLGFVRPGAGAATASADADPARATVAAGVAWLRARGVATIRCPVQLSTWYGHRAMTAGFPHGAGAIPAFPLEPQPLRALPVLLEAAGFLPAHRAVSCLVDSAAIVSATAGAVQRVATAGARTRPIRLAELDAELRLLYHLSESVFEETWGLSAITFDEFVSIYRPLTVLVDPELIRILELADGTPAGFVLALPGGPDLEGSGAEGRTFVLKTLGVTAAARLRVPGIGVALVGWTHEAALRRGYTSGIHALMADGAMAHRLSLRWGRVIRSYATFELPAP
jgi:hypothetical protein